MRTYAVLFVAAFVAGCASSGIEAPAVTGDAIETPLTSIPGDPVRGREVLAGRDGNCLLCHVVPETGVRFMGNLGPRLSGIGSRLTPGKLRLRLVDGKRLNPGSIMPSYYQTDGLVQVADAYRGRTILTAQQIEDTIAYLMTLR